jgi:hypothetical protein
VDDLDYFETLNDMRDLLTTGKVAKLAGVTAAAVRQWVKRGHLLIARMPDGTECRNEHGHPLYWRIDAAKAEYATRERARRAA